MNIYDLGGSLLTYLGDPKSILDKNFNFLRYLVNISHIVSHRFQILRLFNDYLVVFVSFDYICLNCRSYNFTHLLYLHHLLFHLHIYKYLSLLI